MISFCLGFLSALVVVGFWIFILEPSMAGGVAIDTDEDDDTWPNPKKVSFFDQGRVDEPFQIKISHYCQPAKSITLIPGDVVEIYRLKESDKNECACDA